MKNKNDKKRKKLVWSEPILLTLDTKETRGGNEVPVTHEGLDYEYSYE